MRRNWKLVNPLRAGNTPLRDKRSLEAPSTRSRALSLAILSIAGVPHARIGCPPAVLPDASILGGLPIVYPIGTVGTKSLFHMFLYAWTKVTTFSTARPDTSHSRAAWRGRPECGAECRVNRKNSGRKMVQSPWYLRFPSDRPLTKRKHCTSCPSQPASNPRFSLHVLHQDNYPSFIGLCDSWDEERQFKRITHSRAFKYAQINRDSLPEMSIS